MSARGPVVPGSRAAYVTLFVLFLANFLNFFDRVIPAVVLEPVREEFGLDDTALGAVSAAFTVVYALLSLPAGYLVDVTSRTRVLAGGIGIWSAFTAASGLAGGFVSFFVARMGVGVGEATCVPASTSLIGDLVPARQRARAFGLFMLGFPLGTLSALVLAGWVADRFGWRAAFLIAAVPGLVIACALALLREPVRGADDAAAPQPGGTLRTIVSSAPFWAICMTGAALNMAAYSLATYLPAFFTRVHGLGTAAAGGSAGIVLGLSGLIGLTAGGWLADRAAVGRPHGRAALGMAGCAIAAPLLLVGLRADGAQAATVLLAVGWTLYFLFFVTAHTTLLDQFDAALRGRAIGLFLLLSGIVGGGGGSVLAGRLSDIFRKEAVLDGAGAELARALGLQQSLAILVPGGLLLGALGYGWAAWAIRRRR